MPIAGATRVVGLIGTPIVQVKMPGLINAHWADKGVDAVMVPVDLAPDAVPAYVATVRGWANCPGLVVTVPFKQVVAALCDDLTPRARRVMTANIVRRGPDGRLTGDIMDGAGFVAAARADGFDPAGKRAAVVGAGGVASAIADALCDAGAASLRVQDLDRGKQDKLVAILREAFPAVDVQGGIASVADLDLLVNGTPVGMNGDPSLPLDRALLDALPASARAADVVTAPLVTPFLALAQARGCRIQTGIEMTRPQMAWAAEYLGLGA